MTGGDGTNVHPCPRCVEDIDGVEASFRYVACPHCLGTWPECIAAARGDEPAPHPSIEYPYDGHGGIQS